MLHFHPSLHIKYDFQDFQGHFVDTLVFITVDSFYQQHLAKPNTGFCIIGWCPENQNVPELNENAPKLGKMCRN